MTKKLAKLLKTDSMGDIDTKLLAQILKSKGRKGDTMLAHINPKEAALLKKKGGAGTENPETGLPEFYVDEGGYDLMQYGGGDLGDAASAAQYEYRNPVEVPEAVYNAPKDVFAGGNYNQPTDFSLSKGENIGLQYGAGTGLKPTGYSQLSAPQASTPLPQTGSSYTTGLLPGNYDLVPPVPSQLATNINRPGAPGVPGAAGAPGAAPAKDDSFFNKEFMQKLGLAGLSAIPGIYQTRKAQQQAQRDKAEQMALADPYRKESQALLEKARSGELNAVGQQQMQQLEARLRQGQESRGGVGNAQVQAQLEAFRQQLLQNQYDLGLKVSGIADQIALGAIKTGMEADRYVGELTGNYYNNMFRILSGAQLQPTPTRGA